MSEQFWKAVSALCGFTYFAAWSASFYSQLLLNYQRKTALGLSPDFVIVNPLGFLGLTVWSWGAYFSNTARRQYQERHDGHLPQVSKSDLAFSLHALVLSSLTLLQTLWYFWRERNPAARADGGETAISNGNGAGETTPLVRRKARADGTSSAPTSPLLITRIALFFLGLSGLWQLVGLAAGSVQLLDFFYWAASAKLVITTLKYVPQVWLNYRLRSVQGFAISAVFLDLIGGSLSLAQLVIEAVAIDGQPVGIVANPGKLGLSLLTLGFDAVFIAQKYVLYPHHVREVEGPTVEGEGDVVERWE